MSTPGVYETGSDNAHYRPQHLQGRSRVYGVYRGAAGVATRALVLVDAAGSVRWRHVSPDATNPGADSVLTALEALASPDRPPNTDARPRGGPVCGG